MVVAVNARACLVTGWALAAFEDAGQKYVPVVGFVAETVDGEAGNLDEHGNVHAGNSSVLDKVCTKRRSDPVTCVHRG